VCVCVCVCVPDLFVCSLTHYSAANKFNQKFSKQGN
jgi:hypothetical protein